MASDELLQTREHARRMATTTHSACLTRPNPWSKAQPHPDCRGCVTDADRALWAQIADEITEHLDQQHQEESLFDDLAEGGA